MLENRDITIAVIAEDLAIQDYVVMLLAGEDYQVKAFSSQQEAFLSLNKDTPDLIISEFKSTNINGLDICKALRKSFLFNFIPIIFLIPDTEPLTAAKLTFLGADDYIQKSAIKDELFLKVKLNLYRLARQRDVNVTTKLPGITFLLKDLQKRLELKEYFAIGYVSLCGYEEYNYRYGFEKGSELIKYIASILLKAVKFYGHATDLLTHAHTHHFIFTTYPDTLTAVANKIIEDFDNNIGSYYTEMDRKNGYIMIRSRKLEIHQIPLMSIHIGALLNDYFPVFNPSRIIQIAMEINKSAQATPGKSKFLKEEKKDYPTSSF